MSNKASIFSPPPSGPIKPYTGTFGKKQLHHLLRRTLFGVSLADLKAFEGKSINAVVDALLNVSTTQPAPPVKNYSSPVDIIENKQATDATGKLLFNSDGTPKWVQAKDSTGNLLFNADGTPKWETVTIKGATDSIYDQPTSSPTFNVGTAAVPNIIDISKWTGLKMGDTWVNYRINPADGNNNSDGQRRASLKAWWVKLMIEQERNIREKMTLFWHNHFATEVTDVNNANISYDHIALLRKSALGNFKKLVIDVTLNPAMLIYLNGDTNNGANANTVNENYARELQELFTVGKGLGSGYTEDDVKAAARVLSGWQVTTRRDAAGKYTTDPTVPYTAYYQINRHDKNDKTFSSFYGNKVIKGDATATGGTNEITQMIDMIFSVDEVSKFICRKLFTYFVYYKIDDDIEKNVIEPLAELFRTSKFEIKPVLKALFTSEYFFKQEYMGAMVKSPVDFVIGQLRMMEFALPSDPKAFEAQYAWSMALANNSSGLGQSIGDPPNVAGWAAYYQEPLFYEAWLDSSSIQNRIAIQNRQNFTTANNFVNKESRLLNYPMPYFKVLSSLPTPNDIDIVITDLAALMFPADITQATRDRVKVKFFASTNGTNMKTAAHWTTGVNAFIANAASTDKNAVALKENIAKLFNLMFFAAEYQLH